jgi:RNA polymerase sigma factor (sigma-70 family)
MAMRELSDQDLVEEAKAGSDAAFAALYVRHQRAVHARCFRVLRDHDEAADAAQNAMLSALRALRRDDSPTNLRAWLLSIAHNEAVSLVRRSRPAEPLEVGHAGAGPGADEGAFQRERLRQLVDDLNALPDRQRGALLLREASGFSYRHIASVLGTSAGNARQTVHAARRNLHKRRVGREHGWLGFALPGLAVAWLGAVTANLSGIGKAALVAGVLAVGGGAATALEGGASGGLLGGAVPPAAAATPAPAHALAGLPRHLVAATSTPTQPAAVGQSAAVGQTPTPKRTVAPASTPTQTVAAGQSPAPHAATRQAGGQHTSGAPKPSTAPTQTASPMESGRNAPRITARPAGPVAQVARDCNTGGGQPGQGAPQQDPQAAPAPQQ